MDTEQRLGEQEEACRRYCEQSGLTVSAVHRDIGSGTRLDRSGLTELRDRTKQSAIQGVVVTRLDRLSRSQAQLLTLLDEMEQAQVSLHTTNGRLEDNPTYRYRQLTSESQKEVK